MSKDCFKPTFYRDVVAATTQSKFLSQNRVFDMNSDPKTTEMTTSPKILSIFIALGKTNPRAVWAGCVSALPNENVALPGLAATPLK